MNIDSQFIETIVYLSHVESLGNYSQFIETIVYLSHVESFLLLSLQVYRLKTLEVLGLR